jgi:hypothetical protein
MPQFIVTVKLHRLPEHDPRSKKTGPCPVSGGNCTDVTGEHHSYLQEAVTSDDAARIAREQWTHVTRVEQVS